MNESYPEDPIERDLRRSNRAERVMHGLVGLSVVSGVGIWAVEGYQQLEQIPDSEHFINLKLVLLGAAVVGMRAAFTVRSYQKHVDRRIAATENLELGQNNAGLDILTGLESQS